MQNLFVIFVHYVLLLIYIIIFANVGDKEYIWQKEKKNTEEYSYYST